MIESRMVRLLLASSLMVGGIFSARAETITFDGLAGTAMAGSSRVGATLTGFAANAHANVDGFQFSSSGPQYVLGAAYAAACCSGDFGTLA